MIKPPTLVNGDKIGLVAPARKITREEIKFSQFVSRLQKRFGTFVLDAYITLLRLHNFDDRYIDRELFNVKFTQSNLWKQYKEIEILETELKSANTLLADSKNEKEAAERLVVENNKFIKQYKDLRMQKDRQDELTGLIKEDKKIGSYKIISL